MHCKAVCSADSYQISNILKLFKQEKFNSQKLGNVVSADFENGTAFFFGYGCAVFWGIDDKVIENILLKIQS